MKTNDREALAEAFTTIARELERQHGFTKQELVGMVARAETPEIPATAFNSDLTPLEVLARSFEGEASILKQLGRPKSTIDSALENSRKKQPGELEYEETIYTVPIDLFSDRTLSVLEHICTHLKEEYELTNKQIADLTGKSPKTVWTVLHRAEEKRGEAA